MLKTVTTFFLALAFVFLSVGISNGAGPHSHDGEDAAKRITVLELKKAMRGGDDVVIIDMRASDNSELRLPGDIRIQYPDLKKEHPLLPEDMDVLIATYCT